MADTDKPVRGFDGRDGAWHAQLIIAIERGFKCLLTGQRRGKIPAIHDSKVRAVPCEWTAKSAETLKSPGHSPDGMIGISNENHVAMPGVRSVVGKG